MKKRQRKIIHNLFAKVVKTPQYMTRVTKDKTAYTRKLKHKGTRNEKAKD